MLPVSTTPVPPRSRRRALVLTSIIGAAVLVALAAADLVVVHVAESRLSAQLACRFGSSADLGVSVAGGWNGPGILLGHFGEVTVTAKGISAGGATADIDAGVADVQKKSGTVSTGAGEVSAVITFADLSTMVSAAGSKAVDVHGYGDQLMMSAGGSGQLSLLSQVGVAAHTMRLTPTAIVLGERQIPVETARTLLAARSPETAKALDVREISLAKLPASVQLTAATVGPTGLTVRARLDPMTLAPAGTGAACAQGAK